LAGAGAGTEESLLQTESGCHNGMGSFFIYIMLL
jgi:hypothetical protein